MSDSGPKLSLKVAINKQKSKVMFAEANCDVVDVLLSFLALPLGKVVRILENHHGNAAAVVGSITFLYKSLSNLDGSHFCVGSAKEMLLDPTSWFETEFRRLKLDVTESKSSKYFVCADRRCQEYEGRSISMFSDIATCRCGMALDRALSSCDDGGDYGVFMIKDSSLILISDDLRVVPPSTGFLQTLDSLGIADADEAELTSFSLGIDDVSLQFFNRNLLINPKLAYGCVSENRFLCLDEGSPPEVYFQLLWSKRSKQYYYGQKEYYYREKSGEDLNAFTWSKGLDRFVKEQNMCIVRDDLTVTPYSIASVMAVLNSLGIPMSDVRETELHIGYEEAISIFKASLTSTTAISDALINLMLNKKPKQEI